MLVLNCWYSAVGSQMLVFICWYSNVGFQILVFTCWYSNDGAQMLVFKCWYSTVGILLPSFNDHHSMPLWRERTVVDGGTHDVSVFQLGGLAMSFGLTLSKRTRQLPTWRLLIVHFPSYMYRNLWIHAGRTHAAYLCTHAKALGCCSLHQIYWCIWSCWCLTMSTCMFGIHRNGSNASCRHTCYSFQRLQQRYSLEQEASQIQYSHNVGNLWWSSPTE